MMWEYGWSGPGMLMMFLSSLLWIALIGVLIWAVVSWLNKKNANTSVPTPSAMEILRQRYARGEIDYVELNSSQGSLNSKYAVPQRYQ